MQFSIYQLFDCKFFGSFRFVHFVVFVVNSPG